MSIPKAIFSVLLLVFLSCSSDDGGATILEGSRLDEMLAEREVVLANVIACAASNVDPTKVSVFLYPRPNASNIRYYETVSAEDDKDDFSNYSLREPPLFDVFNGFLLRYEVEPEREKWVIVTFEEGGMVHVSNPIRLKQLSGPTEYLSDNVIVDFSEGNMPQFTWVDGRITDSIIYFHVISDAENELLSGTYTLERQFQYYKLENVVLNITEETPPTLTMDTTYTFTLLAVSEDNWVNLFSEVPFIIEN